MTCSYGDIVTLDDEKVGQGLHFIQMVKHTNKYCSYAFCKLGFTNPMYKKYKLSFGSSTLLMINWNTSGQ